MNEVKDKVQMSFYAIMERYADFNFDAFFERVSGADVARVLAIEKLEALDFLTLLSPAAMDISGTHGPEGPASDRAVLRPHRSSSSSRCTSPTTAPTSAPTAASTVPMPSSGAN